jgi:hypothetical protein
VARQTGTAAGGPLKRLTLELGGKAEALSISSLPIRRGRQQVGHSALSRNMSGSVDARHPRTARHRTSGTSGRIPPAQRSTGTARSRDGTTRCAHLRHIKDGLMVSPLDFPADGPADLLAGAHPGAASPARGSRDRDGGHPDGGCRARTSGATVVTITGYMRQSRYVGPESGCSPAPSVSPPDSGPPGPSHRCDSGTAGTVPMPHRYGPTRRQTRRCRDQPDRANVSRPGTSYEAAKDAEIRSLHAGTRNVTSPAPWPAGRTRSTWRCAR